MIDIHNEFNQEVLNYKYTTRNIRIELIIDKMNNSRIEII